MSRPGDGIRVGAFLASFFAANAVLTAFLPLFLSDRGLSAAAIGTVLGAASLARVAGVPALGWAADRRGEHRAAMIAAALAACGCAVLLASASGAASIAALVILGGIAASSLPPLTDALTLALAAARRLEYGRTRAWGSVAYMLSTASAGAILGRLGSAVVPFLLAGFYACSAMLAAVLPRLEPVHRSAAPGPLGAAFRTTLLATALIQGSHAAYYGFASLYWRASGIPDGVIGLLIAEGIVAEVALFVWGRPLVEWLGPSRLTGIAACACAVRWVAMASTVSVPALAAVQLLHAATFACQHLSSMLVLRSLPAPRAGVAQTILAALGFSAPTGVLIWVSGALYGRYGGHVFLLMAALGGAGLLVAPFLPGGARRR